MLIAPEALAALPGLAGAVVRDAEPLGLAQGAPERVTLDVAGARRDALLRRSPDLERAANNIAALGSTRACPLRRRPASPRRGWGDRCRVLARRPHRLAMEPTAAQLEAVVDALAALHSLPVREGLRRDEPPASLLPGPDFPLHRLGYAAAERDAARPALAAASNALLATPWGFCHGWTQAARVIFAGDPA